MMTMEEQWMRSRWTSLCQRIKAKNHDPAYAFQELQEIYSEEGRFYHKFTHIEQCLAEFEPLRSIPENPDAVELAVWFHDLLYDTTRTDNEERSAKVAVEVLNDWGINNGLSKKVTELILLTKHTTMPQTKDGKTLIDCDLAILGVDPKKFGQYEQDVRKEYAWVPDRAYHAKRTEILQRILEKERIYSTEQMQEKYEKQARKNLTMSIVRMKQKLKVTA